MALRITAYGKMQLVRACTSVEDGWADEFANLEEPMPHAFISPKSAMPQADGFEAGIYSYERSLQASLGSDQLLFNFQEKLALLLELPSPLPTSQDGWRSIPFGEILCFLDSEREPNSQAVIGPASCQRLLKQLDDHADQAYWNLPLPYYDIYLSFQRAARVAASDDGILVIDHGD